MIKIALVGSIDFCTKTEQLVAEQNDLQIISYHYEQPTEAAQLIQTLTPCDAILFSGSLPYIASNKALQHLSIPILYIKQDELTIAITLLHLALKKQMALHRISIDVRELATIETVLHELPQRTGSPFIHVLEDNQSIEATVDFHQHMFLQGKTDYAITSIEAVDKRLTALNIPTLSMISSESSLLSMIERTKQQAILHKSDASQLAIGLVTGISNIAQSFVEEMAQTLQAKWQNENDHFILFTTKGNLEFALHNRSFQHLPPMIHIAFGYGLSALDAKHNATTALNFSVKDNMSSFYIIDASKQLHGPFPNAKDIVKLQVNDPLLANISRKTKLSPANISKLISFSESRIDKNFTANDLASYLQVSRRTAERTLKTLVQTDYAKVVGEEMTYRQGRPSALYELNFPIYNSPN